MNSYFPYDDVDNRLDIEAALSKLSERDMKILKLKASGMTYNDIAKEVGLSANYIGKLVRKLKKTVLAYIEVL